MVANKKVETRCEAVVTREPSLGAMGGSKYVLSGEFGNVGNVHFKPRCTATVTKLQGVSPSVAKMLLRGKIQPMLPLEMRNFSGVLDFSKIPADTYRLSTIFEYAPGEAVRSNKAIEVSVQGDRKVVRFLTEEETIKIGVPW
jgi:hypothetical protein